MALQGTIDSFALDDVLGFLAGSAQSGVLRVEGDRGTVRLWIADGSIVGAESAGTAVSEPVQVVFEALRFTAGSFSFGDDRTGPTDRLEPQAIGAVVQEAAALRDEWDAIEAVLPSPMHGLHAVVPLPHDHVTLDAGSWRIITALGRTDTVASVLARSGMSELDAARVLVALVRQGLVEVGAPATVGAGGSFMVDEVEVHPDHGVHQASEPQPAAPVQEAPRADEFVRLDLGELEVDAERLRAGASVDTSDGRSEDRFPIDDLVGLDSAEDPWSSQPAGSGAAAAVDVPVPASTDRVAQPFAAAVDPGADPAAFAPAADETEADPVLEQATWMSPGAADAIAEVLGAPTSAGGGRTYEGGDPAFR